MIELNLSIEKMILYACGSVLISGLIGLLLFSILSGEGIYTIVSNYVAKNLELTNKIDSLEEELQNKVESEKR